MITIETNYNLTKKENRNVGEGSLEVSSVPEVGIQIKVNTPSLKQLNIKMNIKQAHETIKAIQAEIAINYDALISTIRWCLDRIRTEDGVLSFVYLAETVEIHEEDIQTDVNLIMQAQDRVVLEQLLQALLYKCLVRCDLWIIVNNYRTDILEEAQEVAAKISCGVVAHDRDTNPYVVFRRN